VHPRLVAEFDDAALMKVAAASGLGAVPVPEWVLGDVKRRYGLARAGTATECRVSYYCITARRRVTHPAAAAMIEASTDAREKERRG
jgi:LysR family transcriptional activator of nhaA